MAQQEPPPSKVYTQEQVDQMMDDMKKRFSKVVPQQTADYERILRENQTTIRDNSNMATTLKAVGDHISNAQQKVIWLMLAFHKDFLTVDNFADHLNAPKRNYPLIILGVIGLVGGTLLATNWTGFSSWYGSGYNWVVFWGGIIAVGAGYRIYRNRQKKSIQTTPI